MVQILYQQSYPNSVGIVSGPWKDSFDFSKRSPNSGPYLVSHYVYQRSLPATAGKAAGAWSWLLSSAALKNEWSLTSATHMPSWCTQERPYLRMSVSGV